MEGNDDFVDQMDQYVLSPNVGVEFSYDGLEPGGDNDPDFPELVTEAQSDLYLTINSAERRVVSVFFHLAGVSPTGTGIFDLQIRQSDDQSDEKNGLLLENSLVLDVDADYLDQQIVASSPLEQVSSHVFASQPDRFRGQLQAQLVFDNDRLYLSDAQLTLTALPEFRKHSRLQKLQLNPSPDSGELRKLARRAGGSVETCRKHLKLKLVCFEGAPGAPGPTGNSAKDMLECAKKIWGPGGIDWEDEWQEPPLAFALTSLNPTKKEDLAALCNSCSNLEAGWTPVFFVTTELKEDGGGLENEVKGVNVEGVTANGGTALAVVAISEHVNENVDNKNVDNKNVDKKVRDLVLAHELGHAMRSAHFNDHFVRAGGWRGDAETVVAAPAKPCNTANNCIRASTPWPRNAAECEPATILQPKWSIDGARDCP